MKSPLNFGVLDKTDPMTTSNVFREEKAEPKKFVYSFECKVDDKRILCKCLINNKCVEQKEVDKQGRWLKRF